METYRININWTNKCTLRLANFVFKIATVGFVILFIIDIPVQFVPWKLSLPYYLDFLPKGIFRIVELTMASFIVGFLLGVIRQSSSGLLKISEKLVVIESEKRCDIVNFDEIKRISLLKKPWLSFSYRIEFIYPNYKFKRVTLEKKEDYESILISLRKMAPENFEFYEAEHHSIDLFRASRKS